MDENSWSIVTENVISEKIEKIDVLETKYAELFLKIHDATEKLKDLEKRLDSLEHQEKEKKEGKGKQQLVVLTRSSCYFSRLALEDINKNLKLFNDVNITHLDIDSNEAKKLLVEHGLHYYTVSPIFINKTNRSKSLGYSHLIPMMISLNLYKEEQEPKPKPKPKEKEPEPEPEKEKEGPKEKQQLVLIHKIGCISSREAYCDIQKNLSLFNDVNLTYMDINMDYEAGQLLIKYGLQDYPLYPIFINKTNGKSFVGYTNLRHVMISLGLLEPEKEEPEKENELLIITRNDCKWSIQTREEHNEKLPNTTVRYIDSHSEEAKQLLIEYNLSPCTPIYINKKIKNKSLGYIVGYKPINKIKELLLDPEAKQNELVLLISLNGEDSQKAMGKLKFSSFGFKNTKVTYVDINSKEAKQLLIGFGLSSNTLAPVYINKTNGKSFAGYKCLNDISRLLDLPL